MVRRLLQVHDDQTILDVGAGPMSYAVALTRLGNHNRVIAFDLSFNSEDEAFSRLCGVQPILADAHLLPLPDNSADRILLSSLLHMVPVPSRLLRECKRVLKPNGCMVLSVPNQYRYIPIVMESNVGSPLSTFLRIPHQCNELLILLNRKFHVNGPSGYYSEAELQELLISSGFCIANHEYAPGLVGSLCWELAVLAYIRLGKLVFLLLLFTYPFARVFDAFAKSTYGSEHLIKVVPVQ